jgi:chemotaxis protein MotB
MTANGDLAHAGGGISPEKMGRASGKGEEEADPTGPSDAEPPEKVAEAKAFRAIEEAFESLSGESDMTDRMLSHVRTRTTDDGLVIDIFDTEGAPLFETGSAEPTPTLAALVAVVASVAGLVTNPVSIAGHTDASPFGSGGDDGNWKLSADRALTARTLLLDAGLDPGRIAEVRGRAGAQPLSDDPLDPKNRRVEIVLLRNRPNR